MVQIIDEQLIKRNKKYKVTYQEYTIMDIFTADKLITAVIEVKMKFLFIWITIWKQVIYLDINKGYTKYTDDIINATNQAEDIYRLLNE